MIQVPYLYCSSDDDFTSPSNSLSDDSISTSENSSEDSSDSGDQVLVTIRSRLHRFPVDTGVRRKFDSGCGMIR